MEQHGAVATAGETEPGPRVQRAIRLVFGYLLDWGLRHRFLSVDPIPFARRMAARVQAIDGRSAIRPPRYTMPLWVCTSAVCAARGGRGNRLSSSRVSALRQAPC